MGGVTTILDMPLNSIPPTCTVEALEVKQAAARGKCHVDVGFWGGAIPGNLGDLRGLHDAGVFGFKCFMTPSGVDEFPPLSAEQLEEYLGVLVSYQREDDRPRRGRHRDRASAGGQRQALRRLSRVPSARGGERRDRAPHRSGPAHPGVRALAAPSSSDAVPMVRTARRRASR